MAHGHDIAELKEGQQALREDVGVLKSDVGTILIKLDQLLDREQPS